jgi:hypothetical protein
MHRLRFPKQLPSTKDFIKPPPIDDVGKTTGSIVEILPVNYHCRLLRSRKLTDVISGFLTKKKDITGLADTNPTSYLSKFNPLQKGLFDKLKGIIGASAFTKFLGLKPSGSVLAGNVLSHLFF